MADEALPELSDEAKKVQALDLSYVISPGGEKHMIVGVTFKLTSEGIQWFVVLHGGYSRDITCAEVLTWPLAK